MKIKIQNIINKLKDTRFVFYHKVKRFTRTFEPIFRIIEILLIIAATWLSVASIKSSNQSAREITQHLSKIDSIFISINTNFAEIPKNLQNFNIAVKALDSTARRQEKEIASVNNLMNEQINLIGRKQQLLEDEFNRKPVLKLIIRKADKDTSGRVKLTFYITNTGNAAAEKVQLRFILPDSLKPIGEPSDQCFSFFSSDVDRGIKYAFAENDIIYPSQKKATYQLSLNFVLSFKIPQNNIKDKAFRLGYTIDYTGGSTTQESPFDNPFVK